ncbi:Ribosomal RNA small subunit methyltransferase E [bacterium HR24]|jgi:16S rRNA (uracil1498-N3)-methyltransferase|nr:Ribosomal RNA small subunit methyltransferase E [bacterium HR24]
MRRFYVEPGTVRGRQVTLGPEAAHRLARVLRLRPGEHVVLFDGSGQEWEVELKSIGPRGVAATVVQDLPSPPEPRVRLSLLACLLKEPRFELVLEKAAELGVAEVVPVVGRRSVVRPWKEGAKQERWRRIVIEAAEQCGRARPPELHTPLPMAQALRRAQGLRIVPWEEERSQGMRQLLRSLAAPPDQVSLLVGPEGGLDPQEVEAAREAGFQVVSLGERILRAETAALVACALVMYELGELGP